MSFDDEADAFRNINTLEELKRDMSIAQTVSCLDGYDPDALRVDKAREAILRLPAPDHRVGDGCRTQGALGRVLAEDIVPRINVPAHDNSAMDGYAVRFSDLRRRGSAEGNRRGARRQALRTATWARASACAS